MVLLNNRSKRAYELIQQGVTGDKLIGMLCTEFSLAGYGANEAIKEAMAELARTDVNVGELRVEDHLARREQIYQEAMGNQDNELALKALADMGKLQGIYDATKDTKVEIEFMFPDVIAYKPLTREEMERMRKMMKAEDLARVEAHIPEEILPVGETNEGSSTV